MKTPRTSRPRTSRFGAATALAALAAAALLCACATHEPDFESPTVRPANPETLRGGDGAPPPAGYQQPAAPAAPAAPQGPSAHTPGWTTKSSGPAPGGGLRASTGSRSTTTAPSPTAPSSTAACSAASPS